MPGAKNNFHYYNSQETKSFDRTLFNEDVFDMLQNVVKYLSSDNTIDMLEHYTAVVIDNNDPDKLGRIKANVFGLFDDITDTNLLPWCVPEDESLVGDSYIIPEIGQLIRVSFIDGDIYRPAYTSKIKTPLLFGGDSPSSKCTKNIDNDPVNSMVLFENKFSSLQYNRKTSQLIYKNASGMVIQISTDQASGEGGDSEINGALMIKVGGDDQKAYSLRLDENGVAITDGKKGENFIALDGKNGTLVNHSKARTQLSSGDGSISFDGTAKLGYTNPGQVAPDPSKMGPWNALPVDPMTGMPHSGSIFVVSGKSSDTKFADNLKDAGLDDSHILDISDNFEAHEE